MVFDGNILSLSASTANVVSLGMASWSSTRTPAAGNACHSLDGSRIIALREGH